MESLFYKTILAGIFTLLLIITGVFMRKNEEPYNPLLFALHKLSVVVMVVFVVLIVIQHLKFMDFEGLGLVFFIAGFIFIFVAFVSGVMLSFEKVARDFLKRIHKLSSILAVVMIPVIWLYCH